MNLLTDYKFRQKVFDIYEITPYYYTLMFKVMLDCFYIRRLIPYYFNSGYEKIIHVDIRNKLSDIERGV
jgi:hypothetical protein